MKITKEARNNAKQLFSLCLKDESLDSGKAREVVKWLTEKKPRDYIAILSRFKKLLELYEAENTAVLETASPLADEAAIKSQLQQQHGKALDLKVIVNPDLLGGVRVRIGSNVWDGSIKGRLLALEQGFNN